MASGVLGRSVLQSHMLLRHVRAPLAAGSALRPACLRALHHQPACQDQYNPDLPRRDPDIIPPGDPDVIPDPQPRRNPDIWPGDTPDIPGRPSPDVFPRYPHPDINPPDTGPPDMPVPNVPGQGPYMRAGCAVPLAATPADADSADESACRDLLRSPLRTWPRELPLLKTDGGNPWLEASREAERAAGAHMLVLESCRPHSALYSKALW